MTALNEYTRLECQGLWRDSAAAQRRDVVVSLGGATLVILDPRANRALSHWSLPAIVRRNPGERPARFAPGEEAGEEIEIADDAMIAALGKVGALIRARRPHPGRLRYSLLSAGLVAVLALGLFWVPGAVISHAAAVAPAATRSLIGEAVLADVFRLTGSACAAPEGRQALDRLAARLLPGQEAEIIVLAEGLTGARALPGGYILAGRALVEGERTADALAGHVLAATTAARTEDPLHRLLGWSGVGAAFRLLTTGALPPDRLGGYAEVLLGGSGGGAPPDRLAAAFAEAGVDPKGFLASLQAGDPSRDDLDAALADAGIVPRPLLDDDDWVALQTICGD